MIYRLLKEVIGDRDVQSMKYSAAKQIVSDFYMKLSLITFGQRNQKKIDYLAEQALIRAGLECFV